MLQSFLSIPRKWYIFSYQSKPTVTGLLWHLENFHFTLSSEGATEYVRYDVSWRFSWCLSRQTTRNELSFVEKIDRYSQYFKRPGMRSPWRWSKSLSFYQAARLRLPRFYAWNNDFSSHKILYVLMHMCRKVDEADDLGLKTMPPIYPLPRVQTMPTGALSFHRYALMSFPSVQVRLEKWE